MALSPVVVISYLFLSCINTHFYPTIHRTIHPTASMDDGPGQPNNPEASAGINPGVQNGLENQGEQEGQALPQQADPIPTPSASSQASI